MRTFSERCRGKKLACYGIGEEFERMIKNYAEYDWEKQIHYLIDGNSQKRGTAINVNGKNFQILSLDEFLQHDLENTFILVTCLAYAEVVKHLNTIEKLASMDCYLFHFMFGIWEGTEWKIRQTEEALIPPTIHYCWFGGKEMPDLYKRCIGSWKQYCPDYEIKEWNESNCDISETAYTKQAYEAGKYGFVPDYFRLKIIYENGGIYLDTDVEVLRSLDDLRYNQAFCGLEVPGEAALGLGFGAVKGNPVIQQFMLRYKNMNFINKDGTYNETISPIYQTEDLMKMGMRYGTKLQVIHGMTIYPVDVLSPKNVNTGEKYITPNSYAIHYYDGSWVDGSRLEKKKLREKNVKELQALFADD